jgi:hypothetical protein
MQVTEAMNDWPEATERRRVWLPAAKAGNSVQHPGLKQLLNALEPTALPIQG